MSWEVEAPGELIPGVVADGDLSAKQHYFVKMSGAGTVAVCAALTDVPVGVLQNKPTDGKKAVVKYKGITKVSSDAALVVGNLIGPSGDGQADARTMGGSPDKTHYVVGQVIVASGAAGGKAVALIDCAAPCRAA